MPALERAIHADIERNNADPKPFVWTKSAHDIIGDVNCGRAALKTPPLKRLDKLYIFARDDTLATPSGFRHLFRFRIVGGCGRRTGR